MEAYPITAAETRHELSEIPCDDCGQAHDPGESCPVPDEERPGFDPEIDESPDR
jgi:hypothetical protein